MRIMGIMEVREGQSGDKQEVELISQDLNRLSNKGEGEDSAFLISEQLCSQVLQSSPFISDPVPEFLNGLRVTCLKGRMCRARWKCPGVSLSHRALVLPHTNCMSLG